MIDARAQPLTFMRAALETVWCSRGDTATWSALSVFAIRAVSAGLLFATQVVLARWLGAAEFGIYVSAWTCVLVLGGLSHLGLNVAMMRLAPQYQANGDHALFHGLLHGGRMMALASATTISLLGFAVLWTWSEAHGTTPAVPMLLVLVCLPVFALTDVQDGFGRGQGWTLEAIGPPYIVRPITIMFLVAVGLVVGFTANAVTAMLIALVATMFAAGLQTTLLHQKVARTVPRCEPDFAYSDWLKISLPLLSGGICDVIVQNADVLLLNLFRPSHEIGIYYAAAKTASLALFVHYAVGTAYAGRIAAARALEDNTRVKDLVSEAVRWTFIPSAAVTLGILALGYPILAQFGEGFTDAYPLMFILAVGILARAATGPSEVILNMLGHQRACAKSLALAAAVSVSLNILLIPILSVTGAAIATAAAIMTASFNNWRAVRRLEGLNLFILANIKPH